MDIYGAQTRMNVMKWSNLSGPLVLTVKVQEVVTVPDEVYCY